MSLLDAPAVLLVDDRPENLLALRATLEPLECRMVAVTSGDEALKALLQQEFAVVLLDVQMPGMDGFETAELIKGRQRTRTVPIIFVTAISKERHHVFRGYEAGAVDYLFKPYEPELLRSKVRVFLELDAKSRAAARSEALLRAAFDSAPIGMARLDAEGRFAEVNRAFGELVGEVPAALRDRLLDGVLKPSDRPDRELLRALLEGELDHLDREARLRAADGTEIPCRLTFAPALAAGLPPAIVMQVSDLREQRRADREREQRVREQVARTEAERASATLRALQAISDAAISHDDFDELVADLLNRTADALEVDTAAVVLDAADGSLSVHQVAGADGAARRWYSVVTADAGTEPLSARMASTLVMPLAVAGEPLGTLHVGTLFKRDFSQGQQDLLRLAADRAALAIQRSRLHLRDREITEELQRSLLPAALPEVPGMATAARYLPGGDGERVGGDWYDAVVQDGERLLLIIGDVAGHGIGAASDMGQLRSALRAYALDGHAPAAILERLNSFQMGMGGPGMTTLGLVSVDQRANTATYASAGHLPPLLVTGRRKPAWLEGALGPPLGAVPGQTYRERTVELAEQSTLVLYTDGLVEQRGEPLDDGLARLRESVQGGPADVGELCDRILELTRPGGNADDDVTLLVLRRVGERRRAGRDRRRPAPGRELLARQLAAGTWPHQAVRAARVELPRTALAAGAARRVVGETLVDWAGEEELVDLYAVVSEVVNNAIEHAGGDGPIAVQMAAAAEVLRVEVTSDGPAFSPPEPTSLEEPGGFGLVIIDRLASRWGLDFDPGVCVWFELDRAGGDG